MPGQLESKYDLPGLLKPTTCMGTTLMSGQLEAKYYLPGL